MYLQVTFSVLWDLFGSTFQSYYQTFQPQAYELLYAWYFDAFLTSRKILTTETTLMKHRLAPFRAIFIRLSIPSSLRYTVLHLQPLEELEP